MRFPAWVAPLAVALAVAVSAALMIYAVYQLIMWFTGLIMFALIGLFVVGYGIDPNTIVTPASSMPWGT